MSKIEEIFQELQEKELMDKNVKLMASPKCPNIRSEKKGKEEIISYNPALGKVDLDANCIRFVLLHERRHHMQKVSWRTWTLRIGGVFGAVLFYILTFPVLGHVFFIFFIILEVLGCISSGLIFAFLFGNLFFIIWGHKDEYDADLWAAERLCEYYGIRASSFLDNCVNSVINVKPEKSKNELYNIIQKLIFKLLPTHPSNEKRVESLKKHKTEWKCKNKNFN